MGKGIHRHWVTQLAAISRQLLAPCCVIRLLGNWVIGLLNSRLSFLCFGPLSPLRSVLSPCFQLHRRTPNARLRTVILSH